MSQQNGCVYLIGAGCGNMELITLRGLRLLQQCDAVVYDDLIDEALLDAAPAGAERIYMGKRSGKHSAAQTSISQALVDLASTGKRVARLKGGDPFVFGRGGEEALALQAAGIPFEEVPGISSCIAIPASVGIPVTHRKVSRSFHVVTGHSADRGDGLPEDLERLAGLHGTLVFLMGLAQLEKISARLMEAGKPGETPAAVISGGNSANPATVRGTLSDIAVKVREQQVKSPAVIVVGDVAAMDLSGGISKPLAGVQVGVTGTSAVTSKLKASLEEQGGRVITVEKSVVERLPLAQPIAALCDGKPHWLVLTSANGVRVFFEQLQNEHIDLRRLAPCKFAVIGAPTGRALAQYGIHADLCPETFTSEHLAEALCAAARPGEDVVLLRALKGSDVLPQRLRAQGIPVQEVPLYDLHADAMTTEHTRDIVPELDYLTFSSAGGAQLFLQEHGPIPEHTTCVCIGEVTARGLERCSNHPYLLAKTITAEGITRTILEHHAAGENF